MKIDFETKTAIGIIVLILLFLGTIMIIKEIADEVVVTKTILYNIQIEACQKDTLITCFPTQLSTQRFILCKCNDGTLKKVNYYGELI